MLTLPFKQAEKIDLYTPIKRAVETGLGGVAGAQIDTPLKYFNSLRDEIMIFETQRNNPALLEGLLNSAYSYISMWNTFSQSLTFGPEPVPSLLNRIGECGCSVCLVRFANEGKENEREPALRTA
jgi:hypothetical protein